MDSKPLIAFACLLIFFTANSAVLIDYGEALTKSILYFEAQRSGKLPANRRVQWRGDSALNDGSDADVDLTGGYYDSGDNVKFGFPFAFTITLLSWSVVEYGSQLQEKNELNNAVIAIKWGTDYLIKAHAFPEVLYVEVGDGNSDHRCWQRPEDMTTPRTSYKIDAANPGSDVAGESAAALAAASIVFQRSDPDYAGVLLAHAKQLFEFACNHQGEYQNSVPIVGGFYTSGGFDDELAWAAAWLYRATKEKNYIDFLRDKENTGGTRTLFSWDDKFFGVQILVTKLIMDGAVGGDWRWAEYRSAVEEFVCNIIQKGSNNVRLSPGGALWWQPWNNFQYTTASLLAILAHADLLAASNAVLSCSSGQVLPEILVEFSRSQVDYILGANPKNLSYMVGYGMRYPLKVHHRGASIVSITKDSTPVGCNDGFRRWFESDEPNPNVIDGAIVGGPDSDDQYSDDRHNYQQNEPAIVTTAPFVGVLARLAY